MTPLHSRMIVFSRPLCWALGAVLFILLSVAPCNAAPGEAVPPVQELDTLVGKSAGEASAGTAARVALFDTAVVWMLHPAMADFVWDEGTFLRPLPADVDPKDRPVVLRSRHQESDRKARAAAEVKARAEKAIHDLQVEELTLSNALRTRVNARRDVLRGETARADVATRARLEAAFSKDVEGFEKGFWDRKKAIDGELAVVRQTIFKSQDAARSVAFLDGNERRVRFESIARDIREALAEEVRMGRFTLVINRGHLGPPEGSASAAPAAGSDGFVARPIESYTNTYHDVLTSVAPTNDPARQFQFGPNLEYQLRNWIDQRGRLRNVVSGVAAGDLFSFVIAGGEDVTSRVLRRVLEKHRIPADRVSVILKSIESP